MKKQMLLDTIKKIQAAVSDVQSLNQGGCGIFALACIQELMKKGFQVNVWFADERSCHVHNKEQIKNLQNDETVRNLSDMNKHGIHCGHAIIEVKPKQGNTVLFDSQNMKEIKKGEQISYNNFFTGFNLTQNFKLGECPIPFELFEKAVNNRSGWNWMFCRDTWKDLVFEKVKKVFDTVE